MLIIIIIIMIIIVVTNITIIIIAAGRQGCRAGMRPGGVSGSMSGMPRWKYKLDIAHNLPTKNLPTKIR